MNVRVFVGAGGNNEEGTEGRTRSGVNVLWSEVGGKGKLGRYDVEMFCPCAEVESRYPPRLPGVDE